MYNNGCLNLYKDPCAFEMWVASTCTQKLGGIDPRDELPAGEWRTLPLSLSIGGDESDVNVLGVALPYEASGVRCANGCAWKLRAVAITGLPTGFYTPPSPLVRTLQPPAPALTDGDRLEIRLTPPLTTLMSREEEVAKGDNVDDGQTRRSSNSMLLSLSMQHRLGSSVGALDRFSSAITGGRAAPALLEAAQQYLSSLCTEAQACTHISYCIIRVHA